jgi:hypothetical protein
VLFRNDAETAPLRRVPGSFGDKGARTVDEPRPNVIDLFTILLGELRLDFSSNFVGDHAALGHSRERFLVVDPLSPSVTDLQADLTCGVFARDAVISGQ